MSAMNQITNKVLSLFRSGKKDGYRCSYSQGNSYNTHYEENPLKVSTIFACIDAISSDIARLPFEPYEITANGSKRKAINDDTYELLNFEPNPYMTRYVFFKTMMIALLTEGNAFAVIERGANGDAQSITPIPSNEVRVERDDNGFIKGYYLTKTSKKIEANDMIHLLNFSKDGITGMSALSFASNTLGLVVNSEKQALKSFSDSVTSILSSPNPHLSNEQREAMRKEWNENMSEFGSGLAILSSGLQYQKINSNSKENQLLESRAYNVPETCRFFRMSPVKVGDLSKSSYSTVEATGIAYMSDTLSPYMELIELEFRRKIYPSEKRKKMRIEFDPSSLFRADSSAMAQLYSSLFPLGAITSNELREKLNLPAIEGGDTAFVMVNTAPLKERQQTQKEKSDGE